MPHRSNSPITTKEREETIRVRADNWAKDEAEVASDHTRATHLDLPVQDPKAKEKGEDTKGTPRLPPAPLATANLRIPVAIAAAPTTPPGPATNDKTMKRARRVNNHTNKPI